MSSQIIYTKILVNLKSEKVHWIQIFIEKSNVFLQLEILGPEWF